MRKIFVEIDWLVSNKSERLKGAKNVIRETCLERLKNLPVFGPLVPFFLNFPTRVGKCVGTCFYTKSDVGKLLRKYICLLCETTLSYGFTIILTSFFYTKSDVGKLLSK